MSDDGHRAWVAANPGAYVEVLIPRLFLAAHAAASQPAAPEGLGELLDKASGRRAAGGCIRTSWPTALLAPLADYAEECARTWRTGRTWGLARDAADALATHTRHMISRES